MAKAKKPYVYFGVNLPAKLARKFEFHLAAARKLQPYQTISKSAFMAHIIGEWTSILDDPAYDPSVVMPVRRRVRPPLRPSRRRGKAQLTHDEVRAIRADARPLRNIARDMKVNISTVSRVKAGKLWSSVT